MHISELQKATERGEFSMRFVAADGEVVRIPHCVCTSYHSKGRTMNVKSCESGEIRKVVRITIIEINDEEVYL
jgi:ribosomal protein S3AE